MFLLKRRAMCRLKKKNDFVTHVFRAYLDHNLSDMYIRNIRLIYRTNCTLSRTKKTRKIVRFFRLIYRTNSILSRTKKHTQNSQIFLTYISDKFYAKSDQNTRKMVRFFRFIYRTNSMLSRTKKHAQNVFCLKWFLGSISDKI